MKNDPRESIHANGRCRSRPESEARDPSLRFIHTTIAKRTSGERAPFAFGRKTVSKRVFRDNAHSISQLRSARRRLDVDATF